MIRLVLSIIFLICIFSFCLNVDAIEVKINGDNIEVKTDNKEMKQNNDSVSVIIKSNNCNVSVLDDSIEDGSVAIGSVESSGNNGKNITKITNLHNVTIVHDGEKTTKIINKNEKR